jgi:hypothetical protein
MHQRTKRILLIIGIFLAVVTGAWMAGRQLLLSFLIGKIEKQLYSLRDAGYIVKYDSIKLDWGRNKLEVFNLSIRRSIDTVHCSGASKNFIEAKYIVADEIEFQALLLKKKLSFGKITLDSARICLLPDYFHEDSARFSKNEFSIQVDQIEMPDLFFHVHNKDACKPDMDFKSDVVAENFSLAFYTDQPAYGNIDKIFASDAVVHLPEEQYTLKVRSISVNLPLGLADIDTVRIIPDYNKSLFGRKRGYQVDRFEGIIPYVNLYGLNILRTDDTLGIAVQKMTTQLHLTAYRDKRVPFKNGYKKLPIEQINSFPFGLKIDSVILNKSYVKYEEFAEEADSSGYVFFTDLYATIRDVYNRPSANHKMVLVAEGSFMGKSVVHLDATFPTNPKLRHEVRGSISGVDIKELNPIMEPVLGVKAEGGSMEKIRFYFTGNSLHADGNIQFDSRDLKIVSYRDKPKKGFFQKLFDTDDDKVQKAGLKTFIINHLILRKERNKNQPFESRTGTIDFDRNTSKYIFNYWWKAVGSGVKSAYKIDKIEDNKIVEALTKKEKG